MAALVRRQETPPLRAGISATLLLLTLLCLLACRKAPPAAQTWPPCGAGFRTDAALQAQLERQWQTVAVKVVPRRTLSFECSCFGPGASASVEGQNIYLPSAWALPEQTARAAHLASHRGDPPWANSGGAGCDARVEQALAREVEAHALELDTRRALGVSGTRYPFESEYFATPSAERRARLRDYFLSHPEGDGVVPGFVSEYRARCAKP